MVIWCNNLGKIYVLKEPRRNDKEWNVYALREAARLKKWFTGVYYNPRLGRLLAVFKPTPGTHINKLVFEELGESMLKDSYKMVCPKGCSRCCTIHSGAFIIEDEVRLLPTNLQAKVMEQPSVLLRTPGGPIRVYRLDTGSMGRCIFLDIERGTCILEEGGKYLKPIVCLITFCTVFAEKNGEKYLKTGYTIHNKKVVLLYRRVGGKEWEWAIRRMGSVLRRLQRYRKRLENANMSQ